MANFVEAISDINNYVKPAISGAVAAVTFSQMYPNQNVTLVGQSVSMTAAGFTIGALSTVVTEAISMFVLPHISKDVRLQHLESLALTLGSSAAAFWLLPRFLIKGADQNSATTNQRMMLTGVMAEIVSQWIFESFFTGKSALFTLA